MGVDDIDVISSQTTDKTAMEIYIEKFKEEYYQLKMQYEFLKQLVVKYDAQTLGFIPVCPIDALKDQKRQVGCCLHKFEVMAEKEGIEL